MTSTVEITPVVTATVVPASKHGAVEITPVVTATVVVPARVMTLTKRGSKEQCIFGEAATLRAGGSARLTLESHPGVGIGKKFTE